MTQEFTTSPKIRRDVRQRLKITFTPGPHHASPLSGASGVVADGHDAGISRRASRSGGAGRVAPVSPAASLPIWSTQSFGKAFCQPFGVEVAHRVVERVFVVEVDAAGGEFGGYLLGRTPTFAAVEGLPEVVGDRGDPLGWDPRSWRANATHSCRVPGRLSRCSPSRMALRGR
jgi:hypothetical protein